MASNEWYYSKNGQQLGPIPFSALVDLARSGQLLGSDLVWSQDLPQWQAAGQTAGLFDATPQPIPYSAGGYPPPGNFQPGGYSQPGAAAPLGYYAAPFDGPNYAGFWMRFCAAFLDGLILLIPSTIISWAVFAAMGQPMFQSAYSGSGGFTPQHQMAQQISTWVQFLAAWPYFALMECSSYQGTLGKHILGLKVVDLAGQPISFGRASGRYFGRILSTLICCMGYFMAGFTEKRQALHDMVSGCLVVRK